MYPRLPLRTICGGADASFATQIGALASSHNAALITGFQKIERVYAPPALRVDAYACHGDSRRNA
jgi:hypothetical protein